MDLPGAEEKVAFLSRPEVYPDHVFRVETKQTHMSWVFLTETRAWKLKKPERTEYLDFGTPEARRLNCEREVRLNRRLAPDVYHGVVPLTVRRGGALQLGGTGKSVDWLVCMRRLPSDRMLDEIIARREACSEDTLRLMAILSAFYKRASRIRMTGPQYRRQLVTNLQDARIELSKIGRGILANLAQSVVCSQLEFLSQNSALFDDRVQSGKIVEAHGDLRPEHICMERLPVIIDCLEFNRGLRVLDIASDLTFLALECERLGAPDIAKLLFRGYGERSGDWPSDLLLAFYKSYHACVRAKIAVCHLKDDGARDQARWIEKARQYLNMARSAAPGRPDLKRLA